MQTVTLLYSTLAAVITSQNVFTNFCWFFSIAKYCRLRLPIIRPVDDVDDDVDDVHDDDDVPDGNPGDGYYLIPEELPAEHRNEFQNEQKPEPDEGLPSDQEGKKFLPPEAEVEREDSTDGSGGRVESIDDGDKLVDNVREDVKESSPGVESDDDDESDGNEGYAAGKIQ